MSDKKEAKIDPEIEALTARISTLEGMMDMVTKKARIDHNLADPLFNILRRYRAYKRGVK